MNGWSPEFLVALSGSAALLLSFILVLASNGNERR